MFLITRRFKHPANVLADSGDEVLLHSTGKR
jgi:hypothetical protein